MVKVSLMYFSDGGHAYMERQMREIAIMNYCLVSQLEPAITQYALQENRPQAFIAFFFAIYVLKRTSWLSGARKLCNAMRES